MANTSPDGIYYPDSNTLMNFDAILATMASSIQNGIGKRLALQEIAVGLKASVQGWVIPKGNSATTVVPYIISTGLADFNQGFTFQNGIATVQTAGMYLVTASLGPSGSATSGGAKVNILKNSIMFASSEVPFSSTVWINSQATSVINCVPGDTISVKGTLTGPPSSTHITEATTTYMSIAMVQAIPSA